MQDIQNKYDDIVKLDWGLDEITGLYWELGIMIEAQGEMLDSIEQNLNEAHDYVEKSITNLTNARKWHQ